MRHAKAEPFAETDHARRVAFTVATAEASLGVPREIQSLPLKARLTFVLEAAMQNPQGIEPGTYALLYRLRGEEKPADV